MAITITIDGDQVCAYAPGGNVDLSIQTGVNTRPTLQLKIQDVGHELLAFQPGGWLLKPIEVLDGATVMFRGLVTSQRNTTEPGLPDIGYIDVRATGYAVRLDARRVYMQRGAEVVSTFVNALLNHPDPAGNTLADEGFTAANATNTLSTTRTIIFDGLTVSECLDAIAAEVGAYWFVDWNKDINFKRLGTTAPWNPSESFTAATGFSSLSTERTSDRYRNTQWVRQDFSLLPPLIRSWAGDGNAREFEFEFPIAQQAPRVTVRTATYAEAEIAIVSVPADGHSVTIAGDTYTFKPTPTAARHVRIEPGTFECARNLAYAINRATAWEGLFFGAGTEAHPTIEAAYPGGGVVTVRVREISTGNGATLAKSGASIDISAATLTGAQPGESAEVSVGIYGQDAFGTADWYYQPGAKTLWQDPGGTTLANGQYIEISYYRLFANSISVRDASAVAAVGGQSWESLEEINDGATQGGGAYGVAASLLRRYGNLDVTLIQYDIDGSRIAASKDLLPGQTQTLTLPLTHGFTGSMLITDITRRWRWAKRGNNAGDWHAITHVQGIAYPGATPDEPWDRWSDLFLPSGGGGATGGATTVGAGGGSGGGGTVEGALITVTQDLTATTPTINPDVVLGQLLAVKVKQTSGGEHVVPWGANFYGNIPAPAPDLDAETLYLFVSFSIGGTPKWLLASLPAHL